jgi:hypothetical protein
MVIDLDALYAKRRQSTMPMTHGFDDTVNRPEEAPSGTLAPFYRVRRAFGPKQRIFAAIPVKLLAS